MVRIKKSHKQLALFIANSRDISTIHGIFKACSPDFIQFVGEIALNTLSGNLSISRHHISQLKSSADLIRLIASSRVNVARRRSLILKNSKVVKTLIVSIKQHLKEI